jgi:hypothetical protein
MNGATRVSESRVRPRRATPPPHPDSLLRLLPSGVYTHLAIDKDAPDLRPIQLPAMGKIVQRPEVEMGERTPLSAQMEERVGPVILINQFTVEPNEADHLLTAWAGRRRLDEAAAWIHLGPVPPRHRGQPGFRQLRGLGVDRTLQARVQEPGVPVKARRFPAEHRGVSPSLQEGGGPGHLCGVTRVSSAGRAPTPRLARPRRGSRPSARPSPASTGTWGTSPIRAMFLVAHIAR